MVALDQYPDQATSEVSELRRLLRDESVEIHVYKVRGVTLHLVSDRTRSYRNKVLETFWTESRKYGTVVYLQTSDGIYDYIIGNE